MCDYFDANPRDIDILMGTFTKCSYSLLRGGRNDELTISPQSQLSVLLAATLEDRMS